MAVFYLNVKPCSNVACDVPNNFDAELSKMSTSTMGSLNRAGRVTLVSFGQKNAHVPISTTVDGMTSLVMGVRINAPSPIFSSPSGSVTLDSLLQPEYALDPISVTVDGTTTDVIDSQPSNRFSLIFFMPTGNFTVVSFLHSLKAYVYRSFTVFGNVIDVMAVPANAVPSMRVTPGSMVMELRLVQPANAPRLMVRTLDGTFTDFKLFI